MAYYLQNVINTSTVLEPVRSVEYWKFDKKVDRDNAVQCIPTAYTERLSNIPKEVTIKTFDHFIDIGRVASYLKMVSKY